MKMAARLVALIIVAAAAFWVWRTFFPSPEVVIRHRLQKLAGAASFSAGDGMLSKMAGAQALPDYFAPTVDISLNVPGRPPHVFETRDQIAEAALGSRQAQGLSVKFPDINVVVNGDGKTAVSDVTLNAHIGGEKDDVVEELQMTWALTNGTWLIEKVQSVQPVSLQ